MSEDQDRATVQGLLKAFGRQAQSLFELFSKGVDAAPAHPQGFIVRCRLGAPYPQPHAAWSRRSSGQDVQVELQPLFAGQQSADRFGHECMLTRRENDIPVNRFARTLLGQAQHTACRRIGIHHACRAVEHQHDAVRTALDSSKHRVSDASIHQGNDRTAKSKRTPAGRQSGGRWLRASLRWPYGPPSRSARPRPPGRRSPWRAAHLRPARAKHVPTGARR